MFSRIVPFSGFRKEISVEGVEFFNGRYTKGLYSLLKIQVHRVPRARLLLPSPPLPTVSCKVTKYGGTIIERFRRQYSMSCQ